MAAESGPTLLSAAAEYKARASGRRGDIQGDTLCTGASRPATMARAVAGEVLAGVRAAISFGPACAQTPQLLPEFASTSQEDCLYLNVWTPVWPSGSESR